MRWKKSPAASVGNPRMAEWIIIGALDALVLVGFRRLGGIGAAANAFKDWGCTATRIGSGPARCP